MISDHYVFSGKVENGKEIKGKVKFIQLGKVKSIKIDSKLIFNEQYIPNENKIT